MHQDLPGLPDISQVTSVPAYTLQDDCGRQVPFIISLLMYTQQQLPVFPPAVICSINQTVDITGRTGLVSKTVLDGDAIAQVIERSIPVGLHISDAILIFRCQSASTAENLFAHLMSSYQVTLLKQRQQSQFA